MRAERTLDCAGNRPRPEVGKLIIARRLVRNSRHDSRHGLAGRLATFRYAAPNVRPSPASSPTRPGRNVDGALPKSSVLYHLAASVGRVWCDLHRQLVRFGCCSSAASGLPPPIDRPATVLRPSTEIRVPRLSSGGIAGNLRRPASCHSDHPRHARRPPADHAVVQVAPGPHGDAAPAQARRSPCPLCRGLGRVGHARLRAGNRPVRLGPSRWRRRSGMPPPPGVRGAEPAGRQSPGGGRSAGRSERPVKAPHRGQPRRSQPGVSRDGRSY